MGLKTNQEIISALQQVADFCHGEGQRIFDKQDAIDWAVLNYGCEVEGKAPVILDMESTGITSGDQAIEIAVIDLTGAKLFESLCKPMGAWEMKEDAVKVHGITAEALQDAPEFALIYIPLKALLEGRTVIIYNAEFDRLLLDKACTLAGLEKIDFKPECLMQKYAQFVGNWSDKYSAYKYVPLNGTHRAHGDCVAALRRLEQMALYEYKIELPEEIKSLLNIENSQD